MSFFCLEIKAVVLFTRAFAPAQAISEALHNEVSNTAGSERQRTPKFSL